MNGGRRFLLALVRPYLRLHLLTYERMMRRSVFPEDHMDRLVTGPRERRILFVGDIAVAGYGILLEGMALPAQVAHLFATENQCGCSWDQISAFDLTAQEAAGKIDERATEADVAIIALGIPDVLLTTDVGQWCLSLESLVVAIRREAGKQCQIVFTGVPPMDEFQPIPSVARRLIARQVGLLNAATSAVAEQTTDATFVPFPNWGVERMYIRDAFSYRAMHHMWAQAIAPHLKPVLTRESTR